MEKYIQITTGQIRVNKKKIFSFEYEGINLDVYKQHKSPQWICSHQDIYLCKFDYENKRCKEYFDGTKEMFIHSFAMQMNKHKLKGSDIIKFVEDYKKKFAKSKK